MMGKKGLSGREKKVQDMMGKKEQAGRKKKGQARAGEKAKTPTQTNCNQI